MHVVASFGGNGSDFLPSWCLRYSGQPKNKKSTLQYLHWLEKCKTYLKSKCIHDNMIWHNSQWMHLFHQHRGRYFVKLNALEKIGHDITQINGSTESVTRTLWPVHGCLELGQLICFQLFTWENQPNNVLRQKSKGAQWENFIAMFVYKFQHSLDQRFGALVLNVSFSWRKDTVDSIHCDATCDKTNARTSQLLQTVVVGSIQQS